MKNWIWLTFLLPNLALAQTFDVERITTDAERQVITFTADTGQVILGGVYFYNGIQTKILVDKPFGGGGQPKLNNNDLGVWVTGATVPPGQSFRIGPATDVHPGRAI